MQKNLSVVIPFYNGLATIPELLERIAIHCRKFELNYEVILVDDSGNEERNRALSQIVLQHSNVRLLRLSKNFGQHAATFVGILHARSGPVVTMDEDLAHEPEMIEGMLQAQKDTDVVYGYLPRTGFQAMARGFTIGMIKPMISSRYPAHTSSFRLLSPSLVERLKLNRPNFIQLEGLIIQNARNFGYVELLNAEAGPKRASGYGFVNTYAMLSGLITHYTMVPWLSLSALIIILGARAFTGQPAWNVLICILMALSLLNLLLELRTIMSLRVLRKDPLFKLDQKR